MSWELIDLPNILGPQVEWAAHGRDASNGTVFKGAGDGKFRIVSASVCRFLPRVVFSNATK